MKEKKSDLNQISETLESLKERIETFCQSEGMSLNQFAIHVGLDPKTIYAIIDGTANPTVKTMTKITTACR